VRRCASSAAVLSFALLALVAPIATLAANLPSIASASVQSAIVAAVQRDRIRFGGHAPIPASIIGIWDDKGHSFVKTFGYENLATKAPLKLADHFRIGSNTKTFVVSVLLQLVTEGKLALDDPLSHFQLGVSVPNARNVTVRELCDMRSGLFEAFDTPQFAALNGRVPKNFNQRMLVAWAVRHKPYWLSLQQHQLYSARPHHPGDHQG
jgi:D-alanyl-D-alanine carboxypeptidase